MKAPDPYHYVPHAFGGRVGIARTDITPPPTIYHRNWGAAESDNADGIHRSLYAAAMAIQDAGATETLVFVAADAGWFRCDADEWAVRSVVLDALDLPPANLIINLSHTHAGPILSPENIERPGGELLAAYFAMFTDRIVTAVRHAIANLAPATITWAVGRCSLAANRDLPDPNGDRYLTGFNAAGTADDTVLVGRIANADGRTIGTLVNYACHPTTLAWSNRLISPDYIGAMREVVEDNTADAPCLFMLGACGELGAIESHVGAVEIAEKNGRQLGFAVMTVLESMLPAGQALAYDRTIESGALLATWRREERQPSDVMLSKCITVEYRIKADYPTVGDVEKELATTTDRFQIERLERKLKLVREICAGELHVSHVWLWRLGDSIWIGVPGEPYSVLQTTLRAAFPDYTIIVMNLVNGWGGYFPPVEMYDLDIYPVWQTPYDRGSLEQLKDACRAGIGEIVNGG